MASIPRVVPFFSWDEWWLVSELLYSESPVCQSEGIGRVAAWRSRGRVPVAIDSTAALLQVTLQDHQQSETAHELSSLATASCSETELCLMYAMAISRFVNGVVDSGEARGKSVNQLAGSIGLPRALVDIRHEATHQDLPTLAVLRAGASLALEWLFDHYWECQRAKLRSPQQAIVDTIRAYSDLQRRALACCPDTQAAKHAEKGKKKSKRKERADATAASHKAEDDTSPATAMLQGGRRGKSLAQHADDQLQRLINMCSPDLIDATVVRVLLEGDGMLFTHGGEPCTDLGDQLLPSVVNATSTGAKVPVPTFQLSPNLASIWDPALRRLSRAWPLHFLASLILALSDMLLRVQQKQTDGSPHGITGMGSLPHRRPDPAQAQAWCLHLLSTHLYHDRQDEEPLRTGVIEHGKRHHEVVDNVCKSVLQMCMEDLNIWNVPVYEACVRLLGLPSSLIDQARALVKLAPLHTSQKDLVVEDRSVSHASLGGTVSSAPEPEDGASKSVCRGDVVMKSSIDPSMPISSTGAPVQWMRDATTPSFPVPFGMLPDGRRPILSMPLRPPKMCGPNAHSVAGSVVVSVGPPTPGPRDDALGLAAEFDAQTWMQATAHHRAARALMVHDDMRFPDFGQFCLPRVESSSDTRPGDRNDEEDVSIGKRRRRGSDSEGDLNVSVQQMSATTPTDDLAPAVSSSPRDYEKPISRAPPHNPWMFTKAHIERVRSSLR